jgi:hypothetical protein
MNLAYSWFAARQKLFFIVSLCALYLTPYSHVLAQSPKPSTGATPAPTVAPAPKNDPRINVLGAWFGNIRLIRSGPLGTPDLLNTATAENDAANATQDTAKAAKDAAKAAKDAAKATQDAARATQYAANAATDTADPVDVNAAQVALDAAQDQVKTALDAAKAALDNAKAAQDKAKTQDRATQDAANAAQDAANAAQDAAKATEDAANTTQYAIAITQYAASMTQIKTAQDAGNAAADKAKGAMDKAKAAQAVSKSATDKAKPVTENAAKEINAAEVKVAKEAWYRYSNEVCSATRAVRVRCQSKVLCLSGLKDASSAATDGGSTADVTGPLMCGFDPVVTDATEKALIVRYECLPASGTNWIDIGVDDPVLVNTETPPRIAILRNGTIGEVRCEGQQP